MSDWRLGRRSRKVGADDAENDTDGESPQEEHLNIVWPRAGASKARTPDSPEATVGGSVEPDLLQNASERLDSLIPVSADVSSHQFSSEPGTAHSRGTPATSPAGDILLRRWWVVLFGALAIAAATYAVSKVVPATYASSSEVVVLVSGTDVNATTLGANNLASQYAQVVNSSQVLSLAATLKKPPVDVPPPSISGGTVGAQNLISIQATAGSAQLAQARAAAVTAAFVKYINQQVANQATHYAQTSSAQLRPLAGEISQTQAALNVVAPKSTKAIELQQTLVTLLAQRAAAQANIAQTAVAGRPSVQVTSAAGPGSQTAPKPTLYALVGFIVGLLILARVVIYTSRRRATKSSSQPDMS